MYLSFTWLIEYIYWVRYAYTGVFASYSSQKMHIIWFYTFLNIYFCSQIFLKIIFIRPDAPITNGKCLFLLVIIKLFLRSWDFGIFSRTTLAFSYVKSVHFLTKMQIYTYSLRHFEKVFCQFHLHVFIFLIYFLLL